jgi:hypothetical protein
MFSRLPCDKEMLSVCFFTTLSVHAARSNLPELETNELFEYLQVSIFSLHTTSTGWYNLVQVVRKY